LPEVRGVAAILAAALASACSLRSVPTVDAGVGPIRNQASPLCTAIAACEAKCDGGDAQQCLQAGNSYSTGQGAPPDERRAAQLFSRACELGNGPACMFAGRMYEFAHGVPVDFGRANALYKKGCGLGDLGGCYNAAIMLEDGRGAAPDQTRAVALYRRVCAAGSSVACEAAARLESALSTAFSSVDGGR
jgi:uncharacterized protein